MKNRYLIARAGYVCGVYDGDHIFDAILSCFLHEQGFLPDGRDDEKWKGFLIDCGDVVSHSKQVNVAESVYAKDGDYYVIPDDQCEVFLSEHKDSVLIDSFSTEDLDLYREETGTWVF